MLQRVGPVEGGTLVVADQGAASSWFFANQSQIGKSELCAFIDPKPTNTVRIFCVGESAMQGYPQPRNLSSSAFLQTMLQDAWPERKVEVLNLGTTAIASFPVLGILTEALEFQPDLMVIYTGNNEFFGSYGIASTGRAGSKPWMQRVSRLLNSLAIVQGVGQLQTQGKADIDRTLMEAMMAETYIGPEDWRRSAAANNLHHNISRMIEKCRARGVPVLVCSLPANECDLAPVGADKIDHLPAATQSEVRSLIARAESNLRSNEVTSAATALRRVLALCPQHARAHFLLGKCFASQGDTTQALAQFDVARDLDSMPWRPPLASQNAVRKAAQEQGAPVCDLLQAFRDASPGGAIGWELMDDHVHPALRGQALIAECIASSLTSFSGPVSLTKEARSKLLSWTDYADRLGRNVYDSYGVAHKIRLLFTAPFMQANNQQAFERYHRLATGIENRLPKPVREVLYEWQATRPFAGSRCPVTAAVAQLELKHDSYESALKHYEIARQASPPYTSWQLEYTYYVLYCRQKLQGHLTPADRELARTTLEQGHFLSRHSASDKAGFIDRYTGLLHLLCQEFAEAIPYLAASRTRLTGFDLVATDQALVMCYLQTRQFDKAADLVKEGLARRDEYLKTYQALAAALPELEKRLKAHTNSSLSN